MWSDKGYWEISIAHGTGFEEMFRFLWLLD